MEIKNFKLFFRVFTLIPGSFLDSNRNLKSSYAHQMTNPPNKPIPITNVSVNINKSINREKSTTEEQTNPHNVSIPNELFLKLV